TDAGPEVVYAAFLTWAAGRLARIAAATGRRSDVESWIAREQARLRSSTPDAFASGTQLLAALDLTGA
ncbi:MAG TPA: hypothetical protein VFP19_03660, partial [Candidatus Limnocylindrales bacterium]|nr:hypothetical protein [Candidatus Limnocylindrales bacterium]